MRKLRLLKVFMVLLLLSIGFTVPSTAETASDVQNTCASALVTLDILHKDAKGSLGLKSKMKRCEFIAAVNNAMCFDKAADASTVKISFKDINSKHWAYNEIRTAVAHGLISAYPDNTIKPDKVITNIEAVGILLKALGYGESISGQTAEIILGKASELGLDKNSGLKADSQLTRGDASIIIYNALTINFNQ